MAERHLESARMWVVNKAYVILTVLGGLFGLGPVGYLIQSHFTANPTMTTLVLTKSLDTLIYLSLGLSLLFIKRYIFRRLDLSSTKIFEGWGLPMTLFVSPYAWVHEGLQRLWTSQRRARLQHDQKHLCQRRRQ